MLHIFRGNRPLSRAALARRFAAVTTASALMLLPLFPAEYVYHRAAIFNYDGSLHPGIHWRVALIVPVFAFSAFALAYVWAGRAGRVYFSGLRGLLCSVLAFFYTALFVSLLGHWLSDETLPFFRLAVVGVLFLPFFWLIPIVGAVAGGLLARKTAPEPTPSRARPQHVVQPLVLSTVPLFAIIGIAQCFPPPETEISKAALQLSDEVWARFDAGDADGVYALFSEESKKLLDRERFVANLTTAWRKANGPPADAATARNHPARRTRERLMWRIYTRSQKFEVGSMQTTAGWEINETAVFDLSSGQPQLYSIAVEFDNGTPGDNLHAPMRNCGNDKRLHCGQINEPLPRPWF